MSKEDDLILELRVGLRKQKYANVGVEGVGFYSLSLKPDERFPNVVMLFGGELTDDVMVTLARRAAAAHARGDLNVPVNSGIDSDQTKQVQMIVRKVPRGNLQILLPEHCTQNVLQIVLADRNGKLPGDPESFYETPDKVWKIEDVPAVFVS